MHFSEILKTLTEKTGAIGSAVLAADGELVEAYPPPDSTEHAAINLIGAHHGIILGIAKDATTRAGGLTAARSVHIWTKNARIAVIDLIEGYYLIIVLGRDIAMGRTTIAAKTAARLVEMEISR
ncbi:MAG: hypothetical protein AABZ23_04335 [Deltaproteobacteria bacterium]